MFNFKSLYSGFVLLATGIGIILNARSAAHTKFSPPHPTQIVLIAPSRETAASREREANERETYADAVEANALKNAFQNADAREAAASREAFVQKLRLRRLYVMVKNGMALTADELKIARGSPKIEQARREQVILKRELQDYERRAYDQKWNEVRLTEENKYPSMKFLSRNLQNENMQAKMLQYPELEDRLHAYLGNPSSQEEIDAEDEEVFQDNVQRLMEYNLGIHIRRKLDSLIFANSDNFIQLNLRIDRLVDSLSHAAPILRNELNSLSIRALLTDPDQFVQDVKRKMDGMPKDINLLNQLRQIQDVLGEYHRLEYFGPHEVVYDYQEEMSDLVDACYDLIRKNIDECRDPGYLLNLLRQMEKNDFGFDRNIREKLLSFNSEQLVVFPSKMIYQHILPREVVTEIDQILAASDGYLTPVDATRLRAKTRGNENETTVLNQLIEDCKPPVPVPIETDLNTLKQKYARRWFERPNRYFDRLNLPRAFRDVRLATKRRFELYEVQSHIQNGAYSNIELRMLFQHREMLLEKSGNRKKLIGTGLAGGGTTLLLRQIIK